MPKLYEPAWTPGDRAVERVRHATRFDLDSVFLYLRDMVAGGRIEGRYRGRDAHYRVLEDRGLDGDQTWRLRFLSPALIAEGRDLFMQGSEFRTADLDHELPLASGNDAKADRDSGEVSAGPERTNRAVAPTGAKRPSGPPPIERNRVTELMVKDIRTGAETLESLGKQLDAVAKKYGVRSRSTVRAALEQAAAIVTNSNSDK